VDTQQPRGGAAVKQRVILVVMKGFNHPDISVDRERRSFNLRFKIRNGN